VIILSVGAQGIDVSKWQGEIDWKAVAGAGVEFAYIKATEGPTYRDPMFRKNIANAHRDAPEILLGCYHFGRAAEPDAAAEAKNFCDELGLYTSCWTLPPMLDIEWDKRTTPISSKQIIAWIAAFVTDVTSQLNVPCGIYTQASFWKYKLASTDKFFAQPLWLAGKTQIPGWTPLINQYSAKGTVAGIKGLVDLDAWQAEKELPRSPSMLTALLTNVLGRSRAKRSAT